MFAFRQNTFRDQAEAVRDDATRFMSGDVEEVLLGDILGEHPRPRLVLDDDIEIVR